MIPKSVSVSTLILALGAVLAWPVWGWAGDDIIERFIVRPSPSIRCMSYVAGQCMDEGNRAQPSCEQRMREAIKAMSPYVVDIYKPFGLDHTKPDETLKDNQHAIKQWNQVMKDCVESGK